MYFAFAKEMKTLFENNRVAHEFMCKVNYSTNYGYEKFQDLERFEFPFTYSVYMKELDIGRTALTNIINLLIEKEYIEWTYKSSNKHEKSRMKNKIAINIDGENKCKKNSKEDSKENSKENGKSKLETGIKGKCKTVKKKVNVTVKETSSINSSINNNNNNYSDIIKYLNDTAGKKFKASTADTRNLIKLRFEEGFLLEDFIYVIENKCSQWLGNEQMEKYLRPATLFGNKFENYLNEKPVIKKKLYSRNSGFYDEGE